MISIQARTCDDAWRAATQLVKEQGIEQESRTFRSSDVTTETLELLHAGLTIEDPRQRVVFARPINPAFALAEVIWILAGSDDLDFIKFWNPLMEKFSTDGKTLAGAYGYRLGANAEGFFEGELPLKPRTSYFVPAACPFNQLRYAYHALKEVPHSRQVVLLIWNAVNDFPVNNGQPRDADVPCNLVSDLKVRDGKLHWMQTMRSNDLFWGTPYNFIQWTTLHEVVAGWLGLELGQFTLSTSSLHVYQDHWSELKAMDNLKTWKPGEQIGHGVRLVELWNPPENKADLRIEGYSNWRRIFVHILRAAVELTRARDPQDVYDINHNAHASVELEEWFQYSHTQAAREAAAYCQWLAVLSAEACRKMNHDSEALALIEHAGNYWKQSWLQWYERKIGAPSEVSKV